MLLRKKIIFGNIIAYSTFLEYNGIFADFV